MRAADHILQVRQVGGPLLSQFTWPIDLVKPRHTACPDRGSRASLYAEGRLRMGATVPIATAAHLNPSPFPLENDRVQDDL